MNQTLISHENGDVSSMSLNNFISDPARNHRPGLLHFQ